MSEMPDDLAGLSPNEAAAFAVNNDISELFAQPEAALSAQPEAALPAQPEAVPDPRPGTVATALRIDLRLQAELEAAAAARGIGSSTLMLQIIEDWVAANRDTPPPDLLGELVRHLDAARQAATSLSRPAA